MFKSRRIVLVVVMTAVVMGLVYGAAYAADPPVRIGVVDLTKVHNDAPRIKQYWEETKNFKDGLEAKLEVRVNNMLLNGTEIDKLVELKTKPAASLTDAEKNTIKQLQTEQENRSKELTDLQQTKTLTDQQSARMKELQDAKKRSEEIGTALTKTYEEQLAKKVDELEKQAEADLREAITKVAAAKGLTVVVAKEAVLFGGVDISDDVIGKLDPKAK